MDFKYSHPAVDLDKNDVEHLWRELGTLFQQYADEKNFELERHIRVTVEAGKQEREITESNLDALLAGRFIRGKVERLFFYHRAIFWDTSGNIQSVRISVSFAGNVDVDISGTKEWIHQVRGFLDDFLKQRKSANSSPRFVSFLILIFAVPLAVAYVAIQRFTLSPIIALPILGLGAFWLALPMWFVAKRLYPVPTMTIDSPVEWPWYVKWAHQVVVIVVVTVIATIILSVLVR